MHKSVFVLMVIIAITFGFPGQPNKSGPVAKNWLNDIGHLIIGGNDASPGEFPWQVSFQELGSPTCGGAIISTTKIVTAAHCLVDLQASDITIVAGAHSIYDPDGTEQYVKVSSFLVHPDFVHAKYWNDIAVLTLSTPLSMNSKVRAIGLAPSGSEPSGSCVTTGWGNIRNDGGTQYPDALQKVTLTTVPTSTCAEKFEGINPIIPGMTCAAGDRQGPCNGDSGGPLACKNGNGEYYLAGVVSWGMNPCAEDPFYPSVFASVGYYASWIQMQL